MPIEPLQTDERREGPVAKKADYETKLLLGCGFTGFLALFGYFMGMWPFLVFPEYTVVGLRNIILLGPCIAAVLGIIAIRKTGPPAVSGYIGGQMAVAVFAYLRLKETMLGKLNVDIPRPEWPDEVAWLVPLLIAFVPFLLAAAAYPYGREPKEE